MRANVTLAQLRAFVAVIRCGTFTAAASELGVAQSTLSQSLKALEEALGVPVVVRQTDGVALTEAGRDILAEAEHVLDAMRRISALAAEARGIQPGVARVATVRSAARRLLPSVLSAFRSAHPQVDVTLFEGSDREVCDLVRSGVAEIGLGALCGEGLTAEPITEDHFVLVTRRGHRLLGRGPVLAGCLDGEPFIMSSDGCEPLVRDLLAEGGAEPDVVLRTGDIATLLGAVREGLGVSIVPELALPQGELLDLRAVPMATQRRRRLLAIEVEGRPRSRAADAMLRVLKAQAAQLSGSLRSVAA